MMTSADALKKWGQNHLTFHWTSGPIRPFTVIRVATGTPLTIALLDFLRIKEVRDARKRES